MLAAPAPHDDAEQMADDGALAQRVQRELDRDADEDLGRLPEVLEAIRALEAIPELLEDAQNSERYEQLHAEALRIRSAPARR